MPRFNKVILAGNLTKDPDLRWQKGDKCLVSTAIAVNDRYTTRNGDVVDDVCFVDLTLRNRTGEIALEFLRTGSPVLVEGKLKLDRYDKDGQPAQKHSVNVDTLQMLGDRLNGQTEHEAAAPKESPVYYQPGGAPDQAGTPPAPPVETDQTAPSASGEVPF